MDVIKAFVGHSFADEDEALVRRFLDILNEIANLVTNFSWEHAERAEPVELTRKVLEKFEGKNLFIGICTANELAIRESDLKALAGQRYSAAGNFASKSSDWITQEIGLAIGKGMKLILLQEDGLRTPGGLQGNIEYIEFTREAPDKSVKKLLQMIGALQPKPTGTAIVVSETVPPEITPAENPTPSILTPQPGWEIENYARAYQVAIFIDDSADAEAIDAHFRQSPLAATEEDVARWEAAMEYAKLRGRKHSNLSIIKSLAQKYPANVPIRSILARALSFFNEHAEAASVFEGAALDASTPEKAMILLGSASSEQALAGDAPGALALVRKMKERVSEQPDLEDELLRTQQDVAKIIDDKDLRLAAMERIVELSPDDTETRFNLAYLYSEANVEDIALVHYLNIPEPDRSGAAWNNMGVAYETLKMPGKSVAAYTEAKSKGETLAMSNLGSRLLSAGFLKEAKLECDAALQIENYHKNVASLLARLQEAPEEEDKTKSQISKKAQPRVRFYRALGKAIIRQDVIGLNGSWQAPECPVTVAMNGSSFSAMGTYEEQANALGLYSNPFKPEPTAYRLSIGGSFSGHMFRGTISRTKVDPKESHTSLLGSLLTQTKILGVLNSDKTELQLLEDPGTTSPKLYSLKKLHAISATQTMAIETR